MKQLSLPLFCLLFCNCVLADNFYADIKYENASLEIPKKSSGIFNFLKKEEKRVIVTASLLSIKDSKELIIIPPQVLENFEINDGKLIRFKNQDIIIKQAHFQSPTEQLVLEVNFYSVDKSQASSFISGIEGLTKTYLAAQLSSEVSEVASSALNIISSILLDNKEVSLKFRGGIDLNRGLTSKILYFDSNGNINEKVPEKGEVAATINFTINGYEERKVHYNLAFSEQSVDDRAKVLFDTFKSSTKKAEMLNSCIALYDHLKQKNTSKSAQDLIAIAINEKGWPQDEIKSTCLHPEIAISYRNSHGLRNIVNCVKNSCLMTKRLIIVALGVKDWDKLKPFTGNEDITELSCFDSQKPKRVYSWKEFDSGSSIGAGFDSFHFTTCLETDSNKKRYEHMITWYDKKVYSHSCDVSTTAPNSC